VLIGGRSVDGPVWAGQDICGSVWWLGRCCHMTAQHALQPPEPLVRGLYVSKNFN